MLLIRPALQKDLEFLTSLESLEVDGFSAQSIEEEYLHPASTILVAESKTQIVGFLIYRILENEIEIIRIVVSALHRRQNVGFTLLMQLKQLHPTADAFLEVRNSNLPAINLYKKLGFQSLHVRKKYYRDGEDALVMRRTI